MTPATADLNLCEPWLRTDGNIGCKDPSKTKAKLERICLDGPDKVHLIADFDMTITQYWVDGKKNASAHGLFMRYSKSTDKFKRETEELCKKYVPIEISQELTEEEKLPHMIAWWNGTHGLIAEMRLHKQDIRNMVAEHPIKFRNGVHQLIELCERHQLPVLVFSAGIADVIDEILVQHRLFTPHTHVISNRIKYDEKDEIIGFYDPLIHVFNKNEFTGLMYGEESNAEPLSIDPCHGDHALPSSFSGNPNASLAHQSAIRTRKNVILVGDMPGDAKMGSGVKHGECLRIGLMNRFYKSDGIWKAVDAHACVDNLQAVAEKEFQTYLSTFDIVLCGDMGFDVWLNQWIKSELLREK